MHRQNKKKSRKSFLLSLEWDEFCTVYSMHIETAMKEELLFENKKLIFVYGIPYGVKVKFGIIINDWKKPKSILLKLFENNRLNYCY